MQYTLLINQSKSLEWGLNSQQAMLFAFIYEVPSWANPITTPDGVFYAISKAKIIEELPLLTDRPDTVYRLLKAVEAAGIIELSHTPSITLVRLTAMGKEWNRKLEGSEKNPTPSSSGRKKIRSASEKNPSRVGKKSDPGSDKSPTNQITSNQITSNQITNHSGETSSAAPQKSASQLAVIEVIQPRIEIPADMPGPKDQDCKTFKAWANYAFAYRKRYQAWPVWNAKVAGQVGQLVNRLGADIAHHVAAYYVSINDARLINDCHSLNNLLAKAEAYHTQWATGRQMNGRTARQMEDTQANINAAQEAARNILGQGERNAFL
jgi:DNA-binding PadR family transcriptional regulator